jgi:hypothetical protein
LSVVERRPLLLLDRALDALDFASEAREPPIAAGTRITGGGPLACVRPVRKEAAEARLEPHPPPVGEAARTRLKPQRGAAA